MLLHDRKKAAEALQALHEAMCSYGEFNDTIEDYLDPLKADLIKKGYIDDDCQAIE